MNDTTLHRAGRTVYLGEIPVLEIDSVDAMENTQWALFRALVPMLVNDRPVCQHSLASARSFDTIHTQIGQFRLQEEHIL